MNAFPPLTYPMQQCRKVLERVCYVLIFHELMEKTTQFLGKCSANLVVMGNPGAGKSRFYLYCAFRLARRLVDALPELTLLLNCGDEYHQYCFKEQAFWKLTLEEVVLLQRNPRVLRLIDGESSRLVGWEGVSILFALPRVEELSRFTKTLSWTYIMPVWDKSELLACNSLLDDCWRLSEDEVVERRGWFGGIPRSVFFCERADMQKETDRALALWWEPKATEFMRSKQPVQEGNGSHRVLQMIPTTDNFQTSFHLDILSKGIGRSIMSRIDQRALLGLVQSPTFHSLG